MLSDESNHTPAAQVVADNDDLLTEILIRLPIRPAIRFKSVSKHWLSLISNPSFSLFRNSRRPNPPISGILLQRSCFLNNPDFDFVPLIDNDDPPKQPFRWLNFVDEPCGGLRILQSCNGLLLCCCSTNRCLDGKFNYYIYNPTTKKFATLPDPNGRVFRYTHGIQSVCAVNLAFDPSKSPHYKAVCVYESETSETLPPQHHYELEIYSSDTGLWTPSGDPFAAADVNFGISVYWNGSIHWISRLGDSLYFNLNIERIATMPMPPNPENLGDRRIRFFGESGGHLHLIEIYGRRTAHFNVYEMERDYSKWFVKYNVDLDWVPSAFPEKISSFLDPSDLHYDEFVILGIVRGEKDEDSFLVLLISGKAIRYNFVDKTFKNLCDIARVGSLLFRGWFNAFQYIQSLACV